MGRSWGEKQGLELCLSKSQLLLSHGYWLMSGLATKNETKVLKVAGLPGSLAMVLQTISSTPCLSKVCVLEAAHSVTGWRQSKQSSVLPTSDTPS